MTRGVLIMGPPRTGTSMTSGLFEAHGAWFGECKPAAPKYPKGCFENVEAWAPTPQIPRRDFAAWWTGVQERQGFAGGLWGAKIRPEMWETHWRQVSDVACAVLCIRDVESAVKSHLALMKAEGKARRTIQHRSASMDRVQREAPYPCVQIDTAAVARRDFATILPAFEALGVAFDEAAAREWVSPSLWHY